MEWTARQREQIILCYAHEGIAFCPDDLEPLILAPESAADVRRHGVNLQCPICSKQSHSPTFPLGGALDRMAPG